MRPSDRTHAASYTRAAAPDRKERRYTTAIHGSPLHAPPKDRADLDADGPEHDLHLHDQQKQSEDDDEAVVHGAEGGETGLPRIDARDDAEQTDEEGHDDRHDQHPAQPRHGAVRLPGSVPVRGDSLRQERIEGDAGGSGSQHQQQRDDVRASHGSTPPGSSVEPNAGFARMSSRLAFAATRASSPGSRLSSIQVQASASASSRRFPRSWLESRYGRIRFASGPIDDAGARGPDRHGSSKLESGHSPRVGKASDPLAGRSARARRVMAGSRLRREDPHRCIELERIG